MKFVSDLLAKLGIGSKKISVEEKEDLGLAMLMREADRTKKVSESTILKKLSR